MTPVSLRRRVFLNLGGMGRVYPTPERMKEKSGGLPYYSKCDIRVALPPGRQSSRFYPQLVRRLRHDWGNGLSLLHCSTGDFGAALGTDRVTMSHVWTEACCLWMDAISVKCGYGHIEFSERFSGLASPNGVTETRVWIFYNTPFPEDLLDGLEYKVTGYLNRLFEKKPYDLQRRINEHIAYRLAAATADQPIDLPRPIRTRKRHRPRRRRSGQRELAATSGR